LIILLLAAAMTINFSGCAAVYGVFAPKDYRPVRDADYPDDALPLYDGAVIYSYEESDTEIELKAGSRGEFEDLAEFYIDELKDGDYVLTFEKDRSNEYIAEGYKGIYGFELVVETPDDDWEKRLYNAVISINLSISSLGNKDELNNFIALVREDLGIIQAAFEEKDNINLNADPEALYAQISGLYTDLSEHRAQLEQRTVPEIGEIRLMHQSEQILFTQVCDIFAEYTQMLDYALTLTDMSDELMAAASTNSNDAYEIYTILNQSISNCVSLLENADVPTFLQSLNSRYLEVLSQMNDAVLFTLIGVEMIDPVRMDAGEYSLSILNREFEKIAEEAGRDSEDRNNGIDADIEQIKSTMAGWSAWLDGVQEAVDSNAESLAPLSEELRLDNKETVVTCRVRTPDIIIPANYRSLDYVVYLECWTNHGAADVLVTVEIPGFTQKFEQKISLNSAEYELVIHPPLVDSASDSLNSSKEAQIVVSVQNLGTGELVLQETRDVTLYSRYDMQWVDELGVPYYENVLAWMTPEAPEVKELLRHTADSASYLTDGALDAVVGYQYAVSGWSELDITYVQAASIMHALASTMGVKYIATPFSTTDVYLQRLATPAEVINKRSGLCAETAVTVASALQATGMHPVLILLPGHMQAAVETWYGSGEYLLIETTALTDAANENFENVIYYLTPDQWAAYVEGEDYTIIDCELMDLFGIKSID